jgi:TRAP-type C4-dicarboxylate transport system substrate-binding protein
MRLRRRRLKAVIISNFKPQYEREGISMKSKRTAMVIFSLVMLIAFFAFPMSSPAKDVIEIKAATWHPLTHRLTEDAFKQYGREIEKRTNGKVKFTWFLGGSLVDMWKVYDELKSGICDYAYFITSLDPNEFLIFNALNLPFMADTSAHASAIGWKMYQEFPEVRRGFRRIHPLGFFSTGMNHVHTLGPPPKKYEDLKGLKMASPGPSNVKYINALGSSGQHIKGGDLYIAMQRKMINGIVFPNGALRSYRLTELISNHTIMGLAADMMCIAMNLEKWNTLPPDVQKVFDDLRESTSNLTGATLTNESEWVVDELKARGDNFYYLPPDEKDRWRGKLKPIYDKWVKEINKKGLNGQEMLERIREIADETRKNPYQPDDWWGRAGRK